MYELLLSKNLVHEEMKPHWEKKKQNSFISGLDEWKNVYLGCRNCTSRQLKLDAPQAPKCHLIPANVSSGIGIHGSVSNILT